MSTWRPPWSAQGQFAVTLLPPIRASNSSRPGDLPGPDRRLCSARAPRGDPGTPRPARRSGLAGPVPARPRPCQATAARSRVLAGAFGAWPDSAGPARQPTPIGPGGAEPSGHAQPAQPQPYRPAPQERRTRQASTDPTRPQRPRPARGMARPRRVCPAWVGEQSKHGCAEAQWQTPRRRRRTDGARLRRNPNLRRGRLHYSALPVQPRSTLRDPSRLGPAGDDPHEATPLLSCRGRWSAQHGGRFNVVTRRRGRLPTPLGGTPLLMLRTIRLVPSGANADHAPRGNKAEDRGAQNEGTSHSLAIPAITSASTVERDLRERPSAQRFTVFCR
jgi:hypothetical protein